MRNDEYLVRLVERVLDRFPDLQIDRSPADAVALRIELFLELRHVTVYPESRVLELMRAAAGRVRFPLPIEPASKISALVWADLRWDTGDRQPLSRYFHRLHHGERQEREPKAGTAVEVEAIKASLRKKLSGVDGVTDVGLGDGPIVYVTDASTAEVARRIVPEATVVVVGRISAVPDPSPCDVRRLLEDCVAVRDRSRQWATTPPLRADPLAEQRNDIDAILDLVVRVAAHIAATETRAEAER